MFVLSSAADSDLMLYSSLAVEILSLGSLSALAILLMRSAKSARETVHGRFASLSTSLAIFAFSGAAYSVHYTLALIHTIRRISSSVLEPNMLAIDTLGDTIPMVLWWADNALLFGLHNLVYIRLEQLLASRNYLESRPRGKSSLTPGWELKYKITETLTVLVIWAACTQWLAAHGSLDYTKGNESELDLYWLRQTSIEKSRYFAPVLLGALTCDLLISLIFVRRAFASTSDRSDRLTDIVLFAFTPLFLIYFIYRMVISSGVGFLSSKEANSPIGMAGRAVFQATILSALVVIFAPIRLRWPLQTFRNLSLRMTAAHGRSQDDTELDSLHH